MKKSLCIFLLAAAICLLPNLQFPTVLRDGPAPPPCPPCAT